MILNSGGCSYHCTYCDANYNQIRLTANLESIYHFIKSGRIKWVYICGEGEPTHCTNIRALKEILSWCHQYGARVCIFTNLQNMGDTELLEYVDNGTLHILIKYDTHDPIKAAEIYGQTDQLAVRYWHNLSQILEVIHCDNGITNVGASIVPTSQNINEMKSLIRFCHEKGIFPLIGQLENAGAACSNFNKLMVPDEALLEVKQHILDVYQYIYTMPTCPATIAGIHMFADGTILLDARSGLSCFYFWLDEPKTKEVGNIENMTYDEIVQAIMTHREKMFPQVQERAKQLSLHPFGGCGGNSKRLLDEYIGLYKK